MNLGVWKKYFQDLPNQGEFTNEEDMDHTKDLDPQEVENPDILDVETPIKRHKMSNLSLEMFKDGESI